MLIIKTDRDMELALATLSDPILKSILAGHYERLAEYDLPLEQLANFAVCDNADATVNAVGWSPLVDRSGVTFGAAGFTPDWEYLHRHDGWFELVVIQSDDGFGFVVLVKDDDRCDAELLAMCRSYFAGS